MSEKNYDNLLYFEGTSMLKLFLSMDRWQDDNKKRFLSMSVHKDGDLFCAIACTNPIEVSIVDGGNDSGQGRTARVRYGALWTGAGS